MSQLSLIQNPFKYNADDLRAMSESDRSAFINSLTIPEIEYLETCWPFLARRNTIRGPEAGKLEGIYNGQLPPPGDWFEWVLQAGRGFGKTRCGAEFIRWSIMEQGCRDIALVAPTAADARDTMVEGRSGILAIFPPHLRPTYEPSKRRVVWPSLGAKATLFSAEEPDRLRGPQHDAAWGDEIATWANPATYDMLLFGLRLGKHPRLALTSTPKTEGPSAKLLKDIKKKSTTVITMGSTKDNRANLAKSFYTQVVNKYEGTRLGRQELEAEDLEDNPMALWNADNIESGRIRDGKPPVSMIRIVVSVDPAGSIADMARFAAGLPLEDKNDGDDAGIVAAGLGEDGRYYVLTDATTGGSPNLWGNAAAATYNRFQADRVVGELNHGGDNVERVIKTVDPNVAYRGVHASRGKHVRAEPISALYEQGKVSHCGTFAKLEDEMVNWVPGMPSPNRLDALVFALTDLMGGGGSMEVEEFGHVRY
jgi:phage terminase large subunit-like protein